MSRRSSHPVRFGPMVAAGTSHFFRAFHLVGLPLLVIAFLPVLQRRLLGGELRDEEALFGANLLILPILVPLWLGGQVWATRVALRRSGVAAGGGVGGAVRAGLGFLVLRLPYILPMFYVALATRGELTAPCCCLGPLAVLFTARFGLVPAAAMTGVAEPFRTTLAKASPAWGSLSLLMIFDWALRVLLLFGFCSAAIAIRAPSPDVLPIACLVLWGHALVDALTACALASGHVALYAAPSIENIDQIF